MRTQAVDAYCCDPPVTPLLHRRRDAGRHPHTTDNVGGLFRGRSGRLALDGLHSAMRDQSVLHWKLQQWLDFGVQELDAGLRLPAELAALLVRGCMPVLPHNIADATVKRGGLGKLRQLCLSRERRSEDDEDDDEVHVNEEELDEDYGDDDASDGGGDLEFDPWDRTWVWDAQLTAELSTDLATWSSSILQDRDDETVTLLSSKIERYISWSMI